MKTDVIIPYKVSMNLRELIDCNIDRLINEDNLRRREFEDNKRELLPHVLEYMHSYFELHNLSMMEDGNSTSGFSGIDGYLRIDIQKKLDFITNNDYYWEYNGACFYHRVLGREIRIWLHKKGKHVATPKLGFSMTSVDPNKTYGESIESEIEFMAITAAKHKKRLGK